MCTMSASLCCDKYLQEPVYHTSDTQTAQGNMNRFLSTINPHLLCWSSSAWHQCDSAYFRPKTLFQGEGKEMVKICCSQVNPASPWFLSKGTVCKRCYLWPWWSKTSSPEKAWQEKMLPWQPENPKHAAPHYPASMPMEWAPGTRAGRGAFSLHA